MNSKATIGERCSSPGKRGSRCSFWFESVHLQPDQRCSEEGWQGESDEDGRPAEPEIVAAEYLALPASLEAPPALPTADDQRAVDGRFLRNPVGDLEAMRNRYFRVGGFRGGGRAVGVYPAPVLATWWKIFFNYCDIF
ncbi:unnamed protein product [Linum trigynum]|uniref:Uncharacterized protein n=1 Tax=Linum trigynum TaxID=586398 RepID=A0AAV2GD43_9ROSI